MTSNQSYDFTPSIWNKNYPFISVLPFYKGKIGPIFVQMLREAFPKEKSQNYGLFPYGGGAQPHSIAFGGVFPNITEAILVDEIST